MLRVGTSGYNYGEWKGNFYPADLPSSKMLAYYSEQFSTVEINYTFYRLPSEKVIKEWATVTPDGFKFTLKASRRITHDAQLHDCRELLEVFLSRADALGPKLGILLFQLPPRFKKEVGVFDAFLDWLPRGTRAAFEFRNASWFSDEVFALLKARNLALCVTDGEKTKPPMKMTADYAYFRLRDEGYEPADIAQWGQTIAEQTAALNDTFVYFKHEDQGKGPQFARALLDDMLPQGQQ